jgi:hypothetical protein
MEIMTSRMLINLYKASEEAAVERDSFKDNNLEQNFTASNNLSVFVAAKAPKYFDRSRSEYTGSPASYD